MYVCSLALKSTFLSDEVPKQSDRLKLTFRKSTCKPKLFSITMVYEKWSTNVW